MIQAYRIVDWDNLYENNRTREMKTMAWVPVPVKHDGSGYCHLVKKNGAERLGAWLAILQTAAKSHPRGTLLRNAFLPHDSESISDITRLDPKIIKETIDVCISIEVGWMEVVEIDGDMITPLLIPHLPAVIPHLPALNRTEQNRTEGNGKEQNNFARFWELYPRKVERKKTLKAWLNAKDKPEIESLLKILENQKAGYQWTKEGGKFIPYPATWLNAGRWDDVIESEPLVEPEYIMKADRVNK